ncbi:MAG: aminoglycoside adenylyltransferase domain-containing protein [Lachnospiraceae bacterium]
MYKGVLPAGVLRKDEDFWLAISADIDEYDFHAYDSRYLVSNVLILGRILSFKREKRILSKYEGGIWMIKNEKSLNTLQQRTKNGSMQIKKKEKIDERRIFDL